MKTDLRHAALATATLLVAYIAPALHAAHADEWTWMVAPYAWVADISTDMDTRLPPAGEDTHFPSLIDDFDGAFEIHIEGQGERFGLFSDFTYLGLADSHDFQRVNTRSDLDTRLFELAGVWSPAEGRLKGLELFAGLRYIDLDLTVQFDPVNPQFAQRQVDVSDSFSDLMLGARYTWAMGERWRLTLRGDGSFGETEGTWNASVVGQYRVKYGEWLFGYRYLTGELEAGDNTVDVTMMGPMVGFGFVF